MRPDARIARPAPAFLEEDSNGWLVTFSDLVLQLFAFVLVAAVLGTGPLIRETSVVAVGPAPRVATRSKHVVDADQVAARPAADALTLARFDVPEPTFAAPGSPAAAPQAAAVAAPLGTAPPVAVPPSVAVPSGPAPVAAVVESLPRPEPLAPSLAMELESFVAAAGLGDAVHVAVNGGGIKLSISDTIGFASGSAELLPDAGSVLAEVRGLIGARPDLVVEVSGHTDDRPLHAGPFRSNLDLSLARAARVARELAAGDAALTERVFAAGYGAARPVAPNDDADGRARNRRVELRLVPGREIVASAR